MIRWFRDCSKDDVPLVGGKCASLGEMVQAGKNVPPGFAVTVNAYKSFVDRTGIDQKIQDAIAAMGTAKPGHAAFAELTKRISPLVEETPVHEEVRAAIEAAYRELSAACGTDKAVVAVRSSATMEDAADTSFAGQHETYLNISGIDDVVGHILKCWASLFSTPALHYRSSKDIHHDEALMAVAVQKMVNARSSGVAFTVDPVTGDRSKIVIEGAWGLGEGVVSGYVTPDHFAVNRDTMEIVENWVSPKITEFVRDPATGHTIQREVEKYKQNLPALTKEEIIQLAKMAISIEQHYGRPMDIEWAVDADLKIPDSLLILQGRPVTVWGASKAANG